MTIEEIKGKLKRYCDEYFTGHGNCHGCPLFERYPLDRPCTDGDADEEVILRENYDILFGTIASEHDPVNHPSHYTQGGIECIDAMVSAFGKEAVAHFCICNAFKYIFRYRLKNGKEDIEKAQWYLNKFKELSYDEEAV